MAKVQKNVAANDSPAGLLAQDAMRAVLDAARASEAAKEGNGLWGDTRCLIC